ncbi:unnamed protein product [Darwinula stevensoni]|uniref:Uncharacterized protein n=1 Tax=Darwinula stevensoni TaxID=69355 RepID=A0A7R9A6I4_9CRUS|nr:unnamed protein product [Darwinula stevensoni]CAG0887913.1 unnamed protein product [Darwinula stevensoni]
MTNKNMGDRKCEELFKILQRGKEILLNANESSNYDLHPDEKNGNDFDTTPPDPTGMMKLNAGHRLSEDFREKMKQWYAEYEQIALIANYGDIKESVDEWANNFAQNVGVNLPSDKKPTFDEEAYIEKCSEHVDLLEAMHGIMSDDVWTLNGIGPGGLTTMEWLRFRMGSYSNFGCRFFDIGRFQSALYCFQRSTSVAGATILASKAEELLKSKQTELALYYYRVLLDKPSHQEEAVEMKYKPVEKLRQTNFVKTMLHADYLLKMLSMGCEVSSKAPFKMRDATGPSGFVTSLPDGIQELVKAISMRKDGQTVGNAHRFWIEAGKLPYHVVADDENKLVNYMFGYCPMKVRTHILKRNALGELVDDCDNDDDIDAEMTPEKEFAADFSHFYDEIGGHFPVLLRLRELHKLGAVYMILKNFADNMEESKKSVVIDTEPIKRLLREMKSQIEYPMNTDRQRNWLFYETLRENGVSESEVDQNELDRVMSNIKKQLAEADRKIVSNIAEGLEKNLKMRQNSLKNLVEIWLNQNANEALVSNIANHLKDRRIADLSQFSIFASKLGIFFKDSEDICEEDHSECVWVPSAFHKRCPCRVYGGVLLVQRLEAYGGGNGGGNTGGNGGGNTGGNGDGSGGGGKHDNKLHRNNKKFTSPNMVFYTINIFCRETGAFVDTYKIGISADPRKTKGIPRRLYVQIKALNEGRVQGLVHDHTKFEYRGRHHIFKDPMERGELEELETKRILAYLTKRDRSIVGNNCHTAKQGRKDMASRNLENPDIQATEMKNVTSQ